MHVRRTLSHTVRTFFPVWLGLLFLALLLKNPALAAQGVRRGLSLAAGTVIPSLFPSMLISEWLMSCGAEKMRFPPLEGIGKRLGYSASGMLCILFGMLCGSPVGARCAASAYRNGEISRYEYERLLPVASVPSPAFLIGTVGVTLLQSYRTGVILYVCVLLSALINALLQKREKQCDNGSVFTSSPMQAWHTEGAHGGIGALVKSVKSAAEGVLSVSAYILLFGTLCDILCLGIGKGLPDSLRALVLSFLEMCGGMQSLVALNPSVWLPFLIGGAAGWSGLSVHVQVISSGALDGVSYKKYLSGKRLQALLCAFFFGISMLFF